MRYVRNGLACVMGSALAVVMAVPMAAPVAAQTIDYRGVLSGPQRTEAERARDRYRHPAQTLEFFGLKPTMTVVEIWPSAGWYTAILAPILGANGRLYLAQKPPANAAPTSLDGRMAADPGTYGSVIRTSFGKDNLTALAPTGSADMVLTFRNVHNWYAAGFAPAAFQAFFQALKPGGYLGVVEHRLPEDRPDAAMMSSGYMKTSTVKQLAEAAGFVFVKSSEVNANPKDKANWPKGVWTLPPDLTMGDVNRAQYQAIGESDRMTLLFRKPAM